MLPGLAIGESHGGPIPGEGGDSILNPFPTEKGCTSSLKIMLLQSQVVCWKAGI